MTDARTRLHSMFNLSETDEEELDARIDAVVAAETAELRARVAELEAQPAAVLALHRKHTDSEHCFIDDEAWPCQTRSALVTP